MPATTVIKEARPTVMVEGQSVPAITQGLRGLLILENSNGLYRCEALFGNQGDVNGTLDFLYMDRKTLDFGKAFTIKYGTDTIFDGRIMALEANFPDGGPPELNVLAEDRFQDLRMTRRTRSFTRVSDADLFNQFANEYGLSPQVDVTGPQHSVLAQVNQSDLAFLRERARTIDAELWMDGKTLHAQSHAKRNEGSLSMTHGRELHAFSVLADLAHQRTSVTVSGWDVASKAGIQQEITDDVMRGELNGDVSGASILAAACGTRKEVLAHTVPLSSQEAQSYAESFFKTGARRFVVGHGSADMNAQLRVGCYVELLNLGKLFSGKYYVTEVRYIFSEDGCALRAEFTAERPGLGRV